MRPAPQLTDPWLHQYYSRYGSPRASQGPLSIAFLIGSTRIGGGNNVVFQHARHALRSGVDVTLVRIVEDEPGGFAWHPALAELEVTPLAAATQRRFDLVIPTWWPTVLALPRLRFRHVAYFVQSIESRFHAVGPSNELAPLAELTYLMRLPTITVALWIQNYLAAAHESPSFLVRNGIDKDTFTGGGDCMAPREQGRLRVLVEGQLGVEMKGVERAIGVARAAGADEVWLLTSSEASGDLGCDRVISGIPIGETAAVYRSCDVLLKLSHVEGMYGPPLEMMHCGGTVVTYDVTGHDEFVVDGVNALVVPTGDDEAAAAALMRLKDSDILRRLCSGAQATAARWPDWPSSSEEFLRVARAVANRPPDPRLLEKVMMASGAVSLHRLVTMSEDPTDMEWIR